MQKLRRNITYKTSNYWSNNTNPLFIEKSQEIIVFINQLATVHNGLEI